MKKNKEEICDKCHNKAVWFYMPGTEKYCDDCVPRGCSCNIDHETGLQDKDEQGRLFPCVEYMYIDEEE